MKFREFNKKLINWYKSNYRPLPWRATNDPYKIWLSEIILQQTRVVQGLPYYKKFIECYPTLKDLALAKDDEVMRIWQGLGYYSRARNLLKCARYIFYELDGNFPEDFVGLKKLPGVGPYTAAAIASIAFKEPVAVVDGNVYRVLSRVFGLQKDISSGNALEYFKNISEKFISDHEPDLYNQAVMELGATICTPRAPQCEECVLAAYCYAYQTNKQYEFPVKTKKVKTKKRQFTYVLIHNKKGCLMKKRTFGDIWAGMYDLLWVDSNFNNVEKLLNESIPQNILSEDAEIYLSESTKKHILSHQKLEASFVHILKEELPEELIYEHQSLKFFTWKEVERLPKPALVNEHLKKHQLIDPQV